jgi:hypothetical protein
MADEIIVKTIRELRRHEWIAFEWYEVSDYSSVERRLLRGHLRTPDEGARAAKEWDEWILSAQQAMTL